jgi:hypothetical protein
MKGSRGTLNYNQQEDMMEPRASEKEKAMKGVLEPCFEREIAASGALWYALKANAHPASGVLFDDGNGGSLVSCVTCIKSHNEIEVYVCNLVDYALLKKSPPIEDASRANLEVYQSGEVRTINTSLVRYVAFIFTLDYVKEHHEDLLGIENAYLLCLLKLHDHTIVVNIPPMTCIPFASCY